MKILKTKRNIDISKSFGNVKITTIHYSEPIKNSDEWRDWTEVSIWYDCDCENCPMGWEDRGYEGECNDCGCLFDNDFNVPVWKCMLPNWIKRKIAKHKGADDVDYETALKVIEIFGVDQPESK